MVVLTIPLLFIGRDTLGEAVIALLYLVPVGWSAARWGQGAGVCAAVSAALFFDFLFYSPILYFCSGQARGVVGTGNFPGGIDCGDRANSNQLNQSPEQRTGSSLYVRDECSPVWIAYPAG